MCNGVRAILAAVVKPTEEAKDLAQELGIEFNAAGLKALGFAGFMEQVREKTGGNTAQLALLFGGVEALVPAMDLTGKAADSFAEILASMGDKAGQTEAAFQKVADTAERDFARLKAAVADELITIGDALLESVRPGTQALMENLDGVGDSVVGVLSVLDDLAVFMVSRWALGAAATAVAANGGIAASFVAIRTAILTTSAAMLANPIGLVATAAGIAAVAVYNFATAEEQLSENAREAADALDRVNAATNMSRVESIKALGAVREETMGRLANAQAALDEARAKLRVLTEDTFSSFGLGAGSAAALTEMSQIEAEMASLRGTVAETDASFVRMAQGGLSEFVKGLLGADQAADELGGGSGGGGLGQLGKSADGLGQLGKSAEVLRRELEELVKEEERVAEAKQTWREKLEDLRAELEGPMAVAILEHERNVASMAEAYHEGEMELRDYAAAQEVLEQTHRDAVRAIRPVTAAIEDARQALNDEISVLKLSGDARRSLIEQMEVEQVVAQATADLTEAQTELYADQIEGLRALVEERQKLQRIEELTGNAVGAAGALGNIVRNGLSNVADGGDFWSSFADGGTDAITGLMDAMGKLNDETGSWADTLAAMWGDGEGDLAQVVGGVMDGVSALIAAEVGGPGIGASIGGAIGSAIGAYFGGQAGAAIGNVIGAWVGGMFDGEDKPRLSVWSSQDDTSNNGPASPFGTPSVRLQNITGSAEQLSDSIRSFDRVIASFLTDDQIDAAAQRMLSWEVVLREGEANLQMVLEQRFDAILSTFDSGVQFAVQYIGGTLEEQVNNLGTVLQLERMANESDLLTGSLSETINFIIEYRRANETIAETYDRFVPLLQAVDEAVLLTGMGAGLLRAELNGLAGGLAEAAGSTERATALLSGFFDYFYTEAERAQARVDAAQQSVESEFADIGLDPSQFSGDGGLQAFREAYEAALPTLSPEQIVQWLEAGNALGFLDFSIQALTDSARQSTIDGILGGNDRELADAGLTEVERARQEINESYDAQLQTLRDNNALASEIAQLEKQRADALAQYGAELRQQRLDILQDVGRQLGAQGLEGFALDSYNLTQRFAQLRDELVALEASPAELAVLAEYQRIANEQLIDSYRALTDATIESLQFDEALRGMNATEQAIAQINRRYDEMIEGMMLNDEQRAELERLRDSEIRDAMRNTAGAASGAAAAVRDFSGALETIRTEWSQDSIRAWINGIAGFSPQEVADAMSLAEVRDQVVERYSTEVARLQTELAGALSQLEDVPWFDQQTRRQLEQRIRTLRGALGVIGDGIEGALAYVDEIFSGRIDGLLADLGSEFGDNDPLAVINERFDQLIEQAESWGATADELAQIEEYRQQALLEAVEDRYQSELDWIRSISEYVDSLLLDSTLSTLTPLEQLAEAQAQYEATLAAALAGDAAAQSSLQGIAQQYLQIARDVFGSSEGYTDIFDLVLANLQAIVAGGPEGLPDGPTIGAGSDTGQPIVVPQSAPPGGASGSGGGAVTEPFEALAAEMRNHIDATVAGTDSNRRELREVQRRLDQIAGNTGNTTNALQRMGDNHVRLA